MNSQMRYLVKEGLYFLLSSLSLEHLVIFTDNIVS